MVTDTVKGLREKAEGYDALERVFPTLQAECAALYAKAALADEILPWIAGDIVFREHVFFADWIERSRLLSPKAPRP